MIEKLRTWEDLLYAVLLCKASVSLNNFIIRNPCLTLQTIDVLRKQLQKQSLIGQQANERMGYGRSVLPWIQFMGKHVERKGIVAEERDVENRFGIR